MDSSAFDLLFLPILWGTLGGIGAGTVLLYAMQAVEAMLKKCSRAPQPIEPATRTDHARELRSHRVDAKRGVISVNACGPYSAHCLHDDPSSETHRPPPRRVASQFH